MKRFVGIALSFLLVLLTVLPSMAYAQPDQEARKYVDGEYDLSLTVLHATNDEESSMAKYVQEPSVRIENGKATVSVTLTSSSMITAFQVENNEKFVDTTIVSKNEEKNTRVVSFEVDDFDSLMNGKVSVDTGRPGFGVMHHDVRLQFNPSDIDLVDKKPAEAPKQGKYADVNYEHLPLTVLHATKDEESSMAKYVKDPSVTIENGKATVTVTLTSSNMITAFQVENQGTFVDTTVIGENEAENTRKASFPVTDLDSILNAKVSVDTKSPFGIMHHDVRLQFDPSGIPLVSEETPKEPNEEPADNNNTGNQDKDVAGNEEGKNVTENNDVNDPKNIENGIYSITLDILVDGTNEQSLMARYVESSALLKVKDGTYHVAATFYNRSWITDFQTKSNGEFVKATSLSFDKKEDIGIVEFKADNLTDRLDATIEVNVPDVYSDTHTVQIAFQLDSIKKLADDAYPKAGLAEAAINNHNGPSTNNRTDSTNGNNGAKTKNTLEVIDPHNLTDGTYIIPFEVLHGTLNQVSMMMEYVESPGYLRVKDGKQYVSITLLKSSWITDFKTEVNGQLTAPKVLRTDQGKDSKVVEFEIEDLFSPLNAWIEVDVPGVYAADHTIRFSFDTDSIQRISEDKYPGLDFDRNGDLNNDNTTVEKQVDKKETNPKTADSTKLILFSLLFIGSLIPLVMKYRKRLIK